MASQPDGDPAPLYCSRERAAAILGLSLGGLSLAMQRGELDGLYMRVGRSVRFYLLALQLRSMGVVTTEQTAQFARGFGSLEGLQQFLGGTP